MSTENENWRDDSSSEENSGNRFERENNYSRPSYNREGGDPVSYTHLTLPTT